MSGTHDMRHPRGERPLLKIKPALFRVGVDAIVKAFHFLLFYFQPSFAERHRSYEASCLPSMTH
jgi:hypothetical protein